MGHSPNSYDKKLLWNSYENSYKKKKNTAQLGDRKQLVTMQRKGETAKKNEERRRHVVENIRLWSERAGAGVILDAGGVFSSSGAMIGYSKEKWKNFHLRLQTHTSCNCTRVLQAWTSFQGERKEDLHVGGDGHWPVCCTAWLSCSTYQRTYRWQFGRKCIFVFINKLKKTVLKNQGVAKDICASAPIIQCSIHRSCPWDFLEVQWLRLHVLGVIPDPGTKTPHAQQWSQGEKREREADLNWQVAWVITSR